MHVEDDLAANKFLNENYGNSVGKILDVNNPDRIGGDDIRRKGEAEDHQNVQLTTSEKF